MHALNCLSAEAENALTCATCRSRPSWAGSMGGCCCTRLPAPFLRGDPSVGTQRQRDAQGASKRAKQQLEHDICVMVCVGRAETACLSCTTDEDKTVTLTVRARKT